MIFKVILVTLLLTFPGICFYAIEDLTQQFSRKAVSFKFDLKTKEGLNMDCLKSIKTKYLTDIGVFHSGREQTDGYNGLYFAEYSQNLWTKINKLSARGSQGILFEIPNSQAILVLYELENHEKGNTIAIRYYQNITFLRSNNFLYEYQISQINDKKTVRNIGTPSIDNITLIKAHPESKYNQFRLNIRYHYCPDGSHDFPGIGYANLVPLRDFVDGQAHWIGGCKQNYQDWEGKSDLKVENAIRKIGIQGKIGQRDGFSLVEAGKLNRYYFYEANLYKEFDWKNWRIVLYSEKDDRALPIPFDFFQVVDVANPHISLLKADSGNYTFFMSFFLPSEGVKPDTGAKAGQMTAQVTISV